MTLILDNPVFDWHRLPVQPAATCIPAILADVHGKSQQLVQTTRRVTHFSSISVSCFASSLFTPGSCQVMLVAGYKTGLVFLLRPPRQNIHKIFFGFHLAESLRVWNDDRFKLANQILSLPVWDLKKPQKTQSSWLARPFFGRLNKSDVRSVNDWRVVAGNQQEALSDVTVALPPYSCWPHHQLFEFTCRLLSCRWRTWQSALCLQHSVCTPSLSTATPI